ncbi:MAG: type II toxin-antitoxin system VapC family toxin [Flammeovirgaceae bacterium]
MANKILLDANILMEVIFNRQKSKECLNLIVNNFENAYISSLSVHICNYFLEKESGNIKENGLFFAQFNKFELNNDLLELAYSIYSKDFEDAIQVASCLENNCYEIYTLDKNMAKNYEHLLKIIIL